MHTVEGATINYNPWLVMNINADPTTIYTGQTSTITADVYKDSANGDHSADASKFFSGPQVTFTTNLGNVGSKSITVDWNFGSATAILRGDEGAGSATVTAADGQVVSTIVNILQAPTVNAATTTAATGNTVGNANHWSTVSAIGLSSPECTWRICSYTQKTIDPILSLFLFFFKLDFTAYSILNSIL